MFDRLFQDKIPDEKWLEVVELVERLRGEHEVTLPPRPAVAHFYIRCSHRDSAESGLGLKAQRRACKPCFQEIKDKEPGLLAGEYYVDEAVSAWRKKLIQRPEGRRMNAALRRGDHVIIARLDRGFRSMADMVMTMQMWERRGIFVHFADQRFDPTSPMGRMFMWILGAFAEMQSMYISARTKEGLAETSQYPNKLQNGRPRMGFKLVGKKGNRRAVPDKEERHGMQLVFAFKQANPKWSWYKIRDEVEAVLAQEQNRKPIPKWDQHDREWPFSRCIYAYKNEILLREEERTGKAKLEARLADEQARKEAREAAKANAASE